MIFKLIPAIDIICGKCVRLTKGDYGTKKNYFNDPLVAAQIFEEKGFESIHIVDLDGAKSWEPLNIPTLYKIAKHTNLKIQFGGGVKSAESAKIALESGAAKIILGSLLLTNPKEVENILGVAGADRVIAGIDVNADKVYINGWKNKTNKSIDAVIDSIDNFGITNVICTDIDKDGTLSGASIDLYKRLCLKYSSKSLFASGGVSSINNLEALKEVGCAGAIIGKAFYEGVIKIEEVIRWSQNE